MPRGRARTLASAPAGGWSSSYCCRHVFVHVAFEIVFALLVAQKYHYCCFETTLRYSRHCCLYCFCLFCRGCCVVMFLLSFFTPPCPIPSLTRSCTPPPPPPSGPGHVRAGGVAISPSPTYTRATYLKSNNRTIPPESNNRAIPPMMTMVIKTTSTTGRECRPLTSRSRRSAHRPASAWA